MKGGENFFNRPQPLHSGAPLDYKVKVQHRSDILMTEQIQTVKNVQDALQRSLSQLEQAKTDDESIFHSRQVNDLKTKNDEMMLIMKVVHKINTELSFARLELQKALKVNGNVNLARKRVGWLEDRMENLLGRKRQRSPARAHLRSALMMDDPRLMMYNRDSRGSDMALGMRPGDDFFTDTSVDETPRIPTHNIGTLHFQSIVGRNSQDTNDSLQTPAHTDQHDLAGCESQPTFTDNDATEESRMMSINENVPDQNAMGIDTPDSKLSQTPWSDAYATARTTSQQSIVSGDLHVALTTRLPSQDVDAQDQEDMSGQVAVLTLKQRVPEQTCSERDGGEKESQASRISSASSPSDTDSEGGNRKDQTFVTEVASAHTRHSKGSRVTIKSPTAELEDVLNNQDAQAPPEDYWQSEHHRFEHSEHAAMLCQLNPLSYHQMGLAVPGNFVKENNNDPSLPWRPKRKGSDVTDIHKLELDRLERRVHRMLDKVHDAAMLSVRHVPQDPLGASILNQFDRLNRTPSSAESKKRNKVDLTLKDKSNKNTSKPTMAKFVNMENLGSQDVVTFPPLDKDRLGSSMSGRLIYYPNPLPYPEKLPITRTNRDIEYPRPSVSFTEDVVGKEGAPDRFVDQRNLLKETKFTSSLYRSKPSRRSPTSSERRFRRMLLGGTPSSEASLVDDQQSYKSWRSRPRTSKKSVSSSAGSGKKPGQKLKATFQTAKTMVMLKDKDSDEIYHPPDRKVAPRVSVAMVTINTSLAEGGKLLKAKGKLGMMARMTKGAGSKWKMMKPKSGALDHSGLKWERVKSIVRDSLPSVNEEERIDAARLLGSLKCGDTMVTFALKERLRNDSSDRVQYESAKSLILLGCWEEEVVSRIVEFMLHGNSDIISDVLKALINGKNVQYVDKRMPSFTDLTLILSELCQFDDVNDKISLDAAVALGKLCVADDNAKQKLVQVLNESTTHVKAQALEILVRQLNYRGWDMTEAVLHQLKHSPVWKYRKNAAKLLIMIGKKHVCIDSKVEAVYELLDKQLWDDPNKNVRQEVARAMAALDMFARACEKAEKRLEDPLEDARAQAVISLGTLGMKNERILRVLLEMLELDSSEYVRLMIIRTLANLNTQDKRVLRVLRDKERGEGPLAREAKKALDVLGRIGAPPNTGKKTTGT